MLIFVDKPSGFTSGDIVRKVKKLYPKAKVGHSGTLDPMASGLLILGVGKDTKKLTQIQKLPKEYITTIDFSLETDTWDKDYYEKFNQYQVVEKDGKKGIIKGNRFIPAPNIEQIKKILDNIKGEVLLPLPIFSAKKIKGRRLYDLARKGKELRITKKMKIYDYKILNYDFPYLKLGLKVGSGTYIRSIGYYIGKQLGLPAALTELRRTAIGDRSVYNLFK